MNFIRIMRKLARTSKNILLKKEKITQSLQRYNLAIRLLLVILFLCISALIVFAAGKIIGAFYSFKQAQEILETDISNLKETLEFEDGKLSLKLPRNDQNLFITAYLDHNESVDFPRNLTSPYKIKGFNGEVLSLPMGKEPAKNNWDEKLLVSSDFLDISSNYVKIYENAKGSYFSKLNPKINNTKFTALEATFFQDQEAKGKDLYLKNSTGVFQAKIFSLFVVKNLGKFTGGVLLENKDYKITSKNLDAKIKNGEVDELLFTKDVIFYQKDKEETVVKGDNAFYDYAKSEIELYGNVFIKSKKNNLWAKSEKFIYNEKTKKGSFKTLPNKKVELEFEI